MKFQYLLMLALAVTMSCKNGKQGNASLDANKKKMETLKKEQSKLNQEIAELEAVILKAEGKPVAVTTKMVTTSTPQEGAFNHYIDVQGEVKCEENIAATTDMGGLVTKVLVREGQNVAKGQTLATTDNSVLLKNIDEIDEQLNLARSVYEKQKRLWEQGIGSQIQMMQAETNKNSLERKKQTVNTQMEKSKIKAPVSGTVDKVFLKVGEISSPGLPAVRVVNLNALTVEAEIPESYAGKIKIGEQVKIEFPALNKTISARVRAVSQVINTLNRSFTAIIDIRNENNVKPNMIAKIKLNDYAVAKTLTIPSNLLQQHLGHDFIIVAEKSGEKYFAKKRDIVLGKSYDGLTQVVSGLSKNDIIIMDGYRDVLDGDELEIAK